MTRYPAELHEPLPPLGEDALTEASAYVAYAMSCYLPEELRDWSDEEILSFVDEQGDRLAQVLAVYPECGPVLKRLQFLRSSFDQNPQLLEELKPILEAHPSLELLTVYLQTLLNCEKYDELSPLLEKAIADYPETALFQAISTDLAFRRRRQKDLEVIFAKMQNNAVLRKDDRMRILYLRYLIPQEQQDNETIDALFKELLEDQAFLENPENAEYACQNLAQVSAWNAMSILCGEIFLKCQAKMPREQAQRLCQAIFLGTALGGYYGTAYRILEYIDMNLEPPFDYLLLLALGDAIHNLTHSEECKDIAKGNLPLLQLNIDLGEMILSHMPEDAPNNDNACRILSDYYCDAGNLQRAWELLGQIPAPTAEDTRRLGPLGVATEHYEEALAALERQRKENPETLDAGFYLNLATALHECHRPDEELYAALHKSLELDPENAQAANFLGYTYAERGIRLEEATTLIQQALDREPQNAAFLDSMAWVRFRQGNYPEALRLMVRVYQAIGTIPIYANDTPGTLEMQDHLRQILLAMELPYLADFCK
ncbi:MAG: hypothetical protein MJ202_05195 [Lentisphaeria bacterium]|nr:hypothetical protein [Lentisphaeria bacterium]